MAKKKKAAKKLSKTQLKKLRGGNVYCTKTYCSGNTCGLKESEDNCGGSFGPWMGDTVNIAANPSGGGKKNK